MDLRTTYPRSVRERLGGYVHLPRMIDKCRAVLAGTQGEYIYPCPLDKRLLEFAGITPEQFQEAVQKNPTDQAIADWFRKTAVLRSREELEAWNEGFLTREPDDEEKWDYFRKLRDAIDPTRTDIRTWADLLDLDEKRPVPRRSVSGPTERHPSSVTRH